MSLTRKILKTVSGGDTVQLSEQLLYDKVIGVRSVKPGTGASMIVHNLAKALSERTGNNICVVDTNFLYPTVGALLGVGKTNTDLLDFSIANQNIVQSTRYMSVYYVGLQNRNLFDMMSSQDKEELIVSLIERLKELFDIVIVDISSEPTNIATYAAVKCNRVIQVADTSLGCITHLKKSQNTMVSLGVPQAKAVEVIINKQIVSADIGYVATLENAGLTVIGEIPISEEIALKQATGDVVYGVASKDIAVTALNEVIDKIVNSVIEVDRPKRFKVSKKTAVKKENPVEYTKSVSKTTEPFELELEGEEEGANIEEGL